MQQENEADAAPFRQGNIYQNEVNFQAQHLIQGFNELEPMYQLEKAGEFNPAQPRAKGTDFIATELARGATMLSNLWYTAWLESGEPLPQRQ